MSNEKKERKQVKKEQEEVLAKKSSGTSPEENSDDAEENIAELAIDPYKGKITKKTDSRDSDPNKPVSLYGFPVKAEALAKEAEWEKATIFKFFKLKKSLKEGKSSYKLYNQINAQINGDEKRVRLDNICRRSLIIALSKILTAKQEMPAIYFQIGGNSYTKATVIQFEPSDVSSKKRQRGNFKMKILNKEYPWDIAYGENCINSIEGILKLKKPYLKGREQQNDYSRRKEKLLKLIEERLPTIRSFTKMDFNKYGLIKITNDTTDGIDSDQSKNIMKKIHFMNGLIFLITIVEVMVRLYRNVNGEVFNYDDDNAKKSDEFPVALAQARSLFLLLNGKITFNDFLGLSEQDGYDADTHRAFYGAVTGRGTIDNIVIMINKLTTINEEYNTTFQEKISFWHDLKKPYLDSNPNGLLISGKSAMYFELKDCYGSGEESTTEDSNYSDSDDLEEVVTFNPSPAQ